MKGYADLADLPDEDDRIRIIGEYAMAGNQVGVPVDEEGADGYEKADRYVEKLLTRFPLLEFVSKSKGAVLVSERGSRNRSCCNERWRVC